MQKSNQATSQNGLPPAIQLFEMVNGFQKSQAIYVAAKLGLADYLKDGPQTTEQLAKLTKVDGDALYRLLRALASIGIFAETSDERYELTPMAEALQTDQPVSLRPYVLLIGDQSWWHSWGNLGYSVTTGKAAFDHLFETNYETYLKQHPALDRIFNDCMTYVSRVNNPAIVQSYDFSRFETVVDLGGGHGSLLTAILQVNPKAKGILFDQPHVTNSCKQHVSQIEERCDFVGGDFFEEVPAGGDVYLLKQIVHDWEDNRVIRILKNCHKVMREHARLLIIEAVIAEGNAQSVNKFFDLHMLVTATGGKERDAAEFKTLLNASGFELMQIIPTPSSFSIIEARPVVNQK